MCILVRCLLSKVILIVVVIYRPCYSWEAEDYELFDLVEEVNKNFYESLNVSQDASSSEIRKAYHRLSLKLHPDHNEDPDADKQFRLLVGIYDVLKDEGKRQKYDQVLKVGLPNWKSPLYYYRKVRKLGLLEITAILVCIFTLGHYIVLWSVYFERRYEIEEVLSSKLKRRDKKLKRGKQLADSNCDLITETLNELSKPSFRDLLPFLLFGGVAHLITRIPEAVVYLKETYFKKKLDEDDVDDDGNCLNIQEESARKTRRKRILEIPEYSSQSSALLREGAINVSSETREIEADTLLTDCRVKVWSEKDIAALTKIMVRYPSGTSGRWEKIALDLQRSVKDVTEMVKNLRNNSEMKHISADLQGLTARNITANVVQVSELTTRDDVLSTEITKEDMDETALGSRMNLTQNSDESTILQQHVVVGEVWSQEQQKCLEQAILRFPRGAEERWDRIADCVPDKSKGECFQRYKYLVEKVKMKRQT